MAQVAACLKNRGIRITGSDEGVYPPMSDFLQQQGIEISAPYRAENIEGAEAVVIGNALSRGNPEVEATLRKRIPFLSLPELIHAEILRDKLPVVVAGTHGKTTTTAAVTHILTDVGLSPGYMVGGLPIGWDAGFQVGSGRWFVIEGDEYDTAFFDKRPKFLHYQPQIALLNNLEFDHADIYSTLSDITVQFERLVNLIPENGNLVINAEDPGVVALARKAHAPVITFGLDQPAEVQGRLINIDETGMEFGLRFGSEPEQRVTTKLWGRHQLFNLVGAAAAARQCGASPEGICQALTTFAGVQRRLELKFTDGRRWLYDDFAHHPTAIRATLESLRNRHKGVPIIAAFEPRSNTMVRRHFQKELADALILADYIALGKVHRPEKIPLEERLNSRQVIEKIQANGKPAFHDEDVEALAAWIIDHTPDHAVIVVMSNGAFSGLVGLLKKRL